MVALVGCLVALFTFPFITVPSLIYVISGFILMPVGFILSIFTGKVSGVRAWVIADKLSPIFLILGVPLIFYFYVWEPLGWAFFAWMILYFLSRIYTGVHKRDAKIHEGWREKEAIVEKFKKLKKGGHQWELREERM